MLLKKKPYLKAVIFDMDGTLVDSFLDFHLMREDLGLPKNVPILEELAKIPEDSEKQKSYDILNTHEAMGAEKSVLFDGVKEFLEMLDQNSLKRGILTRNSRPVAQTIFKKFQLSFQSVVTREDVSLHKPHPEGLFTICQQWDISPSEAIYVGDSQMDILTGKNAGMKTMLFTPNEFNQFSPHFDADDVFHSYVYLKKHFKKIVEEKLSFILKA